MPIYLEARTGVRREENLEVGRQPEERGWGEDQAWDLFSGTGSCLDLIYENKFC